MSLPTIQHTCVDRFFKYVKIDTQSDPTSTTFPSTAKQLDLARVLEAELKAIGATEVTLDEYGYVMATIPSNIDKEVPVICFCSHMDTSPDSSGKNVKPIIHENYDGRDLVLPDDNNQVIKLANQPGLKTQMGNDIITASGLTLLGADNKAGVAEIMDAAKYLLDHPEVKHGKIRILFTPDEEIGRGVDHVDMKRLAADFGYTVDGEALGSLESETFSADGAVIKIKGVSAHPGFAKGAMESAIKIAAKIVSALPEEGMSPETTKGKEGFIHPHGISGSVEAAEIKFILRDFKTALLKEKADIIQATIDKVMKDYPNSSAELIVKEQYRNMKEVLDKHPEVEAVAKKAIERAGIKPLVRSIRGGTDGSRLSFMGLPCPNIFAGEHAFHSKHEWVSVQDMKKAVEVIVNIAVIWGEGGDS